MAADTSRLRPELWEALFRWDTYVRSYQFDDYTDRFVPSYSNRMAPGLIQAAYQQQQSTWRCHRRRVATARRCSPSVAALSRSSKTMQCNGIRATDLGCGKRHVSVRNGFVIGFSRPRAEASPVWQQARANSMPAVSFRQGCCGPAQRSTERPQPR